MSTQGRFVTAAAILIGVLSLPVQVSELLSLLRSMKQLSQSWDSFCFLGFELGLLVLRKGGHEEKQAFFSPNNFRPKRDKGKRRSVSE